MKERQRWQPEEDALLRAYVKQYGPKEWNLVSQRMGQTLHRDPKSCLERWKNYLKLGLKKGSLTPEEQSLVVSLQAKYGNKWKKIAAEVPGRTPKRLGKWWEVFKEKQLKQQQQNQKKNPINAAKYSDCTDGSIPVVSSQDKAAQGPYDHILETFAEKYVLQPKLCAFQSLSSNMAPVIPGISVPDPSPVLSLGSATSSSTTSTVLRSWMNMNPSTTSSSTTSSTPSPSYCKELEEGRQSWVQHKKEATWRLSRLEQQLESEKARKRREKTDEIEAKIRSLREDEMVFLCRIESEYKEELNALHRDAKCKEAKLAESWCSKHTKLAKLVEQIGLVNSINSNGFTALH
ncbi:hypothetical protein CIPAW_04G040200 [Carya illinoinensis]|uniref:Asymmetric leaves 1 n=1 Tax=Carya illinoinensis TaxID=32201 RepID=A0A8T1QRS8_CARIL|nr:hypothetical protein CIPAW_04G040200 [Carya illinoinensis]